MAKSRWLNIGDWALEKCGGTDKEKPKYRRSEVVA